MAKAPRPLAAASLVALGAERLAALLLEHAETDPALRRKLRAALAGGEGAGRLAAAIGRRLRAIGRSRSLVGWERLKPLARELDDLRQGIAGPLAAQDPEAAAALMAELVGLADRVIERSGDGGERAGRVFRAAIADLGRLTAALPERDPAALAERLCAMLAADAYGLADGLLPAMSEALGPAGRAAVRRGLETARRALPPRAGREPWEVRRERARLARQLGVLADLEGDVDGFIAAMREDGPTAPGTAGIAERLIRAGRAEEALAWLDRAPAAETGPAADPLTDLRLAALEALGRRAEAQDLRWAVFERGLSAPHLHEHLRRLPDPAARTAERRALAHAAAHPDRHLALAFLVAWPDLAAADRLVREHQGELDGRDAAALRPAALALAARYPLAATLLHRLLALDVLERAASAQYAQAARDVAACARLAAALPEGAGIESHAAFMARLRRTHGRKGRFWQLLEAGA